MSEIPGLTDIDLDAAAEKSLCDDDCGHCSGAIYRYAHRVNPRALLARLAEVEAERDALQERLGDAGITIGKLSHERANLAAENARLRQECDGHVKAVRESRNYWMGRLYEARRDLAAVRPVVEAAEAWRDYMGNHSLFDTFKTLADAVDAYRAGQKGCSSWSGPRSSSRNSGRPGGDEMTEIPGLELATEAVARVWYNLDHPNGADWWMLAPPADRGLYLAKAEAAVRAGASYLRTGAFREAANFVYGLDALTVEIPSMYLDAISDKLEDLADEEAKK